MQFDTTSHDDDWLKPLFNGDAPRSTSTAAPVSVVPVAPAPVPAAPAKNSRFAAVLEGTDAFVIPGDKPQQIEPTPAVAPQAESAKPAAAPVQLAAIAPPVEPVAVPTTVAVPRSHFERIRKLGRRITRRHVAAAIVGAGVAALLALVIVWHHARDVAVDAAGKMKPTHTDVVPATPVSFVVKPSVPAAPAVAPTPSKAEHLLPCPWSADAARVAPNKPLPAIEPPAFLKADLQKIHANLANGPAGNSNSTPANVFGQVANPWNDMFPDSAAKGGLKRTPTKTN